MKAIFLDIDGVLNSDRSFLAYNTIEGNTYYDNLFAHIDPIAVGLLNRLIDKSGAKNVFSTSHRLMCVDRETTMICSRTKEIILLKLILRSG